MPPARPPLPVLACALVLVLAAGLACERTGETPPTALAPPEVEPVAARARSERPLPAFSGVTFDGERLAIRDLLGRRLVLFFFDADAPAAAPLAQAVARVFPLQTKQNFRVIGVASGAPTSSARAFIERHSLAFPCLDDASGAISRRFGLEIAAAALLVDAEGYITGALGGEMEESEDPAAVLEAALREQLRLPAAEAVLLEPFLGEYPQAPSFRAGTLDGESFDSASLRGRPAIVMFFLYTCPHCHHALGFLKQALPEIPEAQRPRLVAISVAGSPSAVRDELRAKGLDYFPVLLDTDRALQSRFAVLGGVPDILLLDAEGRIRGRMQGWREERDPALLRMRLAKLAGRSVPMLLHQTGYSGSEFCGVCHENQHETWRFTKHARAFDTLVRHGEERDEECVSCHVVGFGKPGGYTLSPATPHLEDVGCETCHGRGGPHLSPGFVTGHDYQATCAGCHDTKHSLGFSYASFLPKVSHAANAQLLALPLAEKRRRLAQLGESRGALFPDAAYVGSAACQGCHPSEHATWTAGAHARALASLEARGKAGDAECLRCHTTGYGRGGFPTGAAPAAHPALAQVGCESCHGPGGDHVAEGARRLGTIVSLGDKCDSCVILQICGGCHDDANDPGFEFAVKERIEAQRHGTIEPGTGKPKGSQTRRVPPHAERLAAVERALAATGGR